MLKTKRTKKNKIVSTYNKNVGADITIKDLIEHLKQFKEDSPVVYSIFGLHPIQRKDYKIDLTFIRQTMAPDRTVMLMIDI